MALRKTKDKYTMLPYRKGGPIDYASLEFDAGEKEVPPDHMEQSREIHEVMGLLFAHFTDFSPPPRRFHRYRYPHLLRPHQPERACRARRVRRVRR